MLLPRPPLFGVAQNTKGGGLTALVLAAREDCIECAQILVAAHADVNQTTRYGWTPLLTAVQNRHYDSLLICWTMALIRTSRTMAAGRRFTSLWTTATSRVATIRFVSPIWIIWSSSSSSLATARTSTRESAG